MNRQETINKQQNRKGKKREILHYIQDNINIKDIIIFQNKIDLIKEDYAKEYYK